MEHPIHGTRRHDAFVHPIFDADFWARACPLDGDPTRWREGRSIEGPRDLALREQAVELARAHGELGPFVEADVFVWSDRRDREKPWLTRIGGKPWRSRRKRWPTAKGRPLLFIGQICLADSMGVLPFRPPGEVMLLFATSIAGGHWVALDEGCHVEFSPGHLDDFDDWGMNIPWNCHLPFEYQGVIHRTRQYTDHKAYAAAFNAAGWKDGGWGIGSVQATSVGTYADLPQGWPFDKGSKDVLLATLSSFYMRGAWPLCDVPGAAKQVPGKHAHLDMNSNEALELSIGDVGAMWVYRDAKGNFKMADASH